MHQKPKSDPFIWINAALEESKHDSVKLIYLRGYENLPSDIGNDIDLLMHPSDVAKTLSKLKINANKHSWHFIRSIQFSPLSVFFSNEDGSDFVHIDLFKTIHYHYLPFAYVDRILNRGHFNGIVQIPNPCDEVFLNVMTRLLYHGVIRDKHRIQANRLLSMDNHEDFRSICIEHVGSKIAEMLVPKILSSSWSDLEANAPTIRKALFLHSIRHRTLETSIAFCSYLCRAISRILNPPGPFIVFEGADEVGKSTLIDNLLPSLKGITGRNDTLLFHWKPDRDSIRIAGESGGYATNPRKHGTRTLLLSYIYIIYHWCGFWVGYFRHLLPARIKNRAVVGDRYSYDFYLDPQRHRLNLPKWILLLAAKTTPQPNLVICLIAEPKTVTERKQELTEDNIIEYQSRLAGLIKSGERFIKVCGYKLQDNMVCTATKQIISSLYSFRS